MKREAVLLDVGGTLWPDKWPASTDDLYRRNLKDVFPQAPDETIDLLLRELHTRDPGAAADMPLTQDTRAAVLDALSAVGLPTDNADSVLVAMDIPAEGVVKPFEGSDELLRTIKSMALTCVLISNATYRTARAYGRDFDSFSIGGFIDAIVSSVDIGYRKPHEAIFRAAAAEAGASPDRCIMIGDSEHKDIVPAARLGMRTIRVAIEVRPPHRTAADILVPSLQDAAEALGTSSHR